MTRLAAFLSLLAAFAWLSACSQTSLPQYNTSTLVTPNAANSFPVIHEYYTKHGELRWPYAVQYGSNGNLWFSSILPYLGRRDTDGKMVKFGLPNKRPGTDAITSMTLGPDGHLWYANYYRGTIGTVDSFGRVHEFQPFTNYGYGDTASIISGPRKHLWVIVEGYLQAYLAELTTAPKVVRAIDLPGYYCWPGPMAAGPNEMLWIGNSNNCPEITRVTMDGTVTNFPFVAANGIWGIIQGPDGNMWFTAASGPKNLTYVGKITPAGDITEYPISDEADAIAIGPDGNFWITMPFVGKIESMTVNGNIVSEYTIPHAKNGSQPNLQLAGMVLGRDGNLWFAEGYRNRIGVLQFSKQRRFQNQRSVP